MKDPVTTLGIAAGAVITLYVGSYFLCVRSFIIYGVSSSVIEAYRYIPLSHQQARTFYSPIHSLDRHLLRRAKWTGPDDIQRVSQ